VARSQGITSGRLDDALGRDRRAKLPATRAVIRIPAAQRTVDQRRARAGPAARAGIVVRRWAAIREMCCVAIHQTRLEAFLAYAAWRIFRGASTGCWQQPSIYTTTGAWSAHSSPLSLLLRLLTPNLTRFCTSPIIPGIGICVLQRSCLGPTSDPRSPKNAPGFRLHARTSKP